MTREEFLKNIKRVFDSGSLILSQKNQDYAGDHNPFKNFETASIAGISVERAILVRILDKMSRIGNLLDRENVVKDEKIEDTILDCINYLAILLVRLENK